MKGSAEIFVESSASKVPSSRFKNNQELTDYRTKTAQDQILESLIKKGYEESQISFAKARSTVQGPDYKNDAIKNRLVYEQFQYVKARAK